MINRGKWWEHYMLHYDDNILKEMNKKSKTMKKTTKNTEKTPIKKEKEYVVICNKESWLVGTRQDIIDDFNEDPDAYIENSKNIVIYELAAPVKFSFVTPQINF